MEKIRASADKSTRKEGKKERRGGRGGEEGRKKKKKQEDDTRQLISQCYFERTRGALSVFSERARN